MALLKMVRAPQPAGWQRFPGSTDTAGPFIGWALAGNRGNFADVIFRNKDFAGASFKPASAGAGAVGLRAGNYFNLPIILRKRRGVIPYYIAAAPP